MISPLLWFVALGPLALTVAGLASGRIGISVKTGNRLALAAASAVLVISITTGLSTAFVGPIWTGSLGWHGIGFGFYLDALSAVMFVLVAFISLIVILYSRNYLDGDPGQGRFMQWLCITLAAVLLLIVAGNLFQLLAAWIATSLSLNNLLLFYPDRQAAMLAARKKFVASRLGDACVLTAMMLIYQAVGSLDYRAVFGAAEAWRTAGAAPGGVHAAAVLLVSAALLKSAQFPFHGWLTEVMETPTPVSALLHAGVVNAGGFLVLRFAGLIALSPHSLDLLVGIGGATALFGSMVMLTETSIKGSLAYSTIAQMGFMMLECGLGAFSTALLHIVAHSLYKAHAFLSSGSVVDLARASWSPGPNGQHHPARTALAIMVVPIALLAMALFGANLAPGPGVFALGAVFLLGLTPLATQAIGERPSASVLARVLALAAVVAVAYVGLQWAVERLTAGSLPVVEQPRGPFGLVIILLFVLAFAAVTVLQTQLKGSPGETRLLPLHVHLSNGFYVNTLANRLTLRLWPDPLRPLPTNRSGKLSEGAWR